MAKKEKKKKLPKGIGKLIEITNGSCGFIIWLVIFLAFIANCLANMVILIANGICTWELALCAFYGSMQYLDGAKEALSHGFLIWLTFGSSILLGWQGLLLNNHSLDIEKPFGLIAPDSLYELEKWIEDKSFFYCLLIPFGIHTALYAIGLSLGYLCLGAKWLFGIMSPLIVGMFVLAAIVILFFVTLYLKKKYRIGESGWNYDED